MNNIYFSIPDYWYLYDLNQTLLSLKEEYPSYFYENIIIDSVFGSFPCIWNGGRLVDGIASLEDIYFIVSSFNKRGIKVRNTFNNVLLTKDHIYDAFGNKILLVCNDLAEKYNIQNGCTVNSEILAEHINKNYPNLQIIWSTNKEITDISKINILSQTNLTILSYQLNNNFEILNQLKNRKNIEILCAEEGCVDNCPARNLHQRLSSEANLFFPNGPVDFKQLNVCPRQDNITFFYDTIYNRKSYLTIDNINQNYLPLGFNQFKISGRTGSEVSYINTIENYVKYFIKPEYQDDIRNKLFILTWRHYEK